jgi:hypothetical protein
LFSEQIDERNYQSQKKSKIHENCGIWQNLTLHLGNKTLQKIDRATNLYENNFLRDFFFFLGVEKREFVKNNTI